MPDHPYASDPTDPADPTDPTDPADPGPTDPADPGPTDPGPDPTDPTEPTDPPEPLPTPVRVRPDVWKLEPWDDALLWYARALAEMRRRSLDDPTGWRYQAAIHAYSRSGDPYAEPTDSLPSGPEQGRFWNQCQHSSWYFLPWHRMYLGFFESMVADTVEALGGPAGWSLPYWNYSDTANPDARRIPPAFREAELPDGEGANPLRVTQRVSAANSGGVVADDTDVNIANALRAAVFVGSAFGGGAGFGGPETAFNHSGGPAGLLESTPHGSMHVAVGGFQPPGFMSRFQTAGLDPLFWLHHANIDRLWTVWLRRDASHANPDTGNWLDAPSFEFHDASGQVTAMTCLEVVDSEASRFAYRYEDESDPLPAPSPAPVPPAPESVEVSAMRDVPAELIGATESTLTLDGDRVTARIELEVPTGPAAERVGESAAEDRIYLNVENVQGSRPVPHLVYVGLPAGADPAAHDEYLAGMLPMFGLAEASGEDPEHPGSGLTYALDVTDLVQRLGADPEALSVTLVPKAPAGDNAEAEAGLESVAETVAAQPIRVGRLSVYRQR